MPEKAFINAWNRLVDGYEEYMPVCKEELEGEDILKAYRAKEMVELIRGTGYISEITYELLMNTLENIKIFENVTMEVRFIAIEITSNELNDYICITK